MIRHAGLIARFDRGRWRGVLIEGASGAGKSDLALRLLDAGFRLVADDRTLVWASEGRLFGRAPETIAGLIEARGHGILTTPAIVFAEIVLAAHCVTGAVERLPDPRTEIIAGVATPACDINPRELSAPAKLCRAMQHLGGTAQQAYQAASRGGGDRAGTGDTH